MKKRNRIVIVTIVFSFLVIVGGGYLVYDKVLQKKDKTTVERDTNKNEEKEEQVVNLDINNDLVKDLLGDLKPYPCLDTYFYIDGHQNLKAEDIDFQRKYSLAVQRLKNVKIVPDPEYANLPEELDDGGEHWMFEVSEEEMEKALKSALGDTAVLEKKSFAGHDYQYTFVLDSNGQKKYGAMSLTYHPAERTFTVKMNDGGGCGLGYDIVKVESASKKGKTITIVEKAMFLTEIGEVESATEFGVYKDLEHKKEIGRVDIEEFNNNSSIADQYLENAMMITYTFSLNEDGSYHFVSSKITN